MKPEIKQRIEQIRNGEVPDGYKRTKAGIVPQDWEIKKLSSVLKKQTQKNRDNAIQKVLTNSATQGIVCQTDYFDKQIANNENTIGYYVVKPGYFVYNPRISVSAPCGPFNRYDGNENGIMSPLYSIYCYCGKSIAYADFLTYYFSSSKWYAYMNSIANYGARSDRMNVTKEDMDNMPIPYPPLSEQQRIVAILSAQDKVIECYENKIEQLKRMKKYYLQNMFPKRGETVPKIRFKGFTDPWEQRKLDNLAQFTKGTGYSKGELKESGTPIILYGRLYTKYETVITSIDTFTDAKPDSVYSRGGEVIVPASGETAEDISIASVVEKSGVLLGGDLNIITPSTTIDSAFLAISISNGTPHNNIAKMAQGKSVVHLHNTDLKKIDLSYPCYEEQRQISDFFKRYDNLITLHQRKLEEERKKKKALQQLLLTGIVRTN